MANEVPVYEWHNANGTAIGCGTEVEFKQWAQEGDTLGKVLCYEPASEDARRIIAWSDAA